jgi:hypothetical protein
VLRAATQEHRAVRALKPEGDAPAPFTRRSPRLARQRLGEALSPRTAKGRERALAAAGRLWRTDGGAKVHHGLVEIARPLGLAELDREAFERAPEAWRRRIERAQAGEHALVVAIQREHGDAKGNGADRGGRIGTDTG